MLEVVKEEDGSGCNGKRTASSDGLDVVDRSLSCVWICPRGFRHWINSLVLLTSMLNFASAHYTHQWAVKIEGGHEVADRIASKYGFVNLGEIFDGYFHFEHKAVRKRSLEPEMEYHNNLLQEAEVKWAEQQKVKKRSKRDLIPLRPKQKSSTIKFNDVRWSQMWYLNRGQGLDMNVQPAWQEGISGKGVVVTILDDGLEKDHPDLMKNYDPQASYDVNSHDEDPMPRYDVIDSNRHGTRCAGEVAAVANNSLCSVGVAFGASVGGVRMLDGDVTDAVEARSLSLNPQHIDIYSASWGPDDDGKTVDGPGELATRAFIEGVTKGRQGKGSIFVWASGNGGRDHDNCNCDGYTNSIWTLSISSATENGGVPWYSEACSSTLATTYSSGASTEKQIVTTDLHHHCTNGHTGTSASAPLAAGICALALEANKDLTWRDMQHIVVRTARPANLISSDWKVNGVGRNVSHSFGYGLMDASAMVRLARVWKTVPEQHRCEVSAPHVDKSIPARSKVILNLTVTECAGVNFLEHVQAKISLSSSRRGDLQIYLTSPAGTRTTLLAKRPQDSSRNPFSAWPFMSVHTWGEAPFGIWQLEIHNEGRFLGRANLQEWSLLFYGTAQVPPGAFNQKPPQRSSSSSSSSSSSPGQSSRQNSLKPNGKPKNNPSPGGGYANRKSPKAWKSKSPGRPGKIPSPARPGNATKSQASPPKSAKSGQRFWYYNKTKAYKAASKTAPPATTTPSLPLTIVLGPSGNLSNPQKVPDIFQKYPKVQQLYPIYVNMGRIYSEENLIGKSELTVMRKHSFQSKAGTGSPISVQKSERQDRYDTSSAVRTSTEGKRKLDSYKKATSRNHLNQGNFEGWQMLFYGTEDSPNEDAAAAAAAAGGGGGGGGGGAGAGEKGSMGAGKDKDALAGSVNVDDDIPNHLEPEIPNRSWKDQATRRDDMLRTTTDPALWGPSSGCSSISKTSSQCIECIRGMFLVQGRCEAKCPVKWYQSKNSDGKPICLPCHYTCLTCAGGEDGHCTSCYDEAVAVASDLDLTTPATGTGTEADDMTKSDPNIKVEDLPVESHYSYGKRGVTKKILEPFEKPRALYYCYPSRLVKELYSSKWFMRMTVFFSLNVILLAFVAVLLIRFKLSKKPSPVPGFENVQYRILKNGEKPKPETKESILYVSSTEEE